LSSLPVTFILPRVESSTATYTTLWRAGDYRCVRVTPLKGRTCDVYLYSGSQAIAYETCTDVKHATEVAQRIWSALVEPT